MLDATVIFVIPCELLKIVRNTIIKRTQHIDQPHAEGPPETFNNRDSMLRVNMSMERMIWAAVPNGNAVLLIYWNI